ncbi:MAG: class I SAM-dependent methyltransferase [Thermodesulfobacteriota bacterium]
MAVTRWRAQSYMMPTSSAFDALADDIARGERFAFGENWRRFLACLDDTRIEAATTALAEIMEGTSFKAMSFLDAGSGSGLSSLAARRLGALVHSFDYDSQSVACTEELRRRYFPDDLEWRIEQGSVLDSAYLEALGTFDIVYSWGVLHHTGDMWTAIDLVSRRVKPHGVMCIAIYNDQRWISRYWLAVKRIYNFGFLGRLAMVAVHAPYLLGLRFLARALTGRLRVERGMSLWHDMLDWLGGLPFETAVPAHLDFFLGARGFKLIKSRIVGRRHGCNEFVFRQTIQ